MYKESSKISNTMPDRKQTPPRLSVEITPYQRRKLNELVDWGDRKELYGVITDAIINLLDGEDKQTRKAFIGAICSKHISLLEIVEVNKDGQH